MNKQRDTGKFMNLYACAIINETFLHLVGKAFWKKV